MVAITPSTVAATHPMPELTTTLAVLFDTVNGDVAYPIANEANRTGTITAQNTREYWV